MRQGNVMLDVPIAFVAGIVIAAAGMILEEQHISVFSAILQFGAFGLLAYIVVYMYPKAAAEARIERESRDKRFSEIIDMLQTKFQLRSDKVVSSLHEQTKALERLVDKQTSSFKDILREQTDTVTRSLAFVCRGQGGIHGDNLGRRPEGSAEADRGHSQSLSI